MGMYDSVMVPCPSCGKQVEFQSKEWDCQMDRWSLEEAPAKVKFDIMNEPNHCEACDNWFALIDPNHPPGRQKPPELVAAKVTSPENPRTHFQGMKWWPLDKPFSYADLAEPIAAPVSTKDLPNEILSTLTRLQTAKTPQ
jgi:hypothetical protein